MKIGAMNDPKLELYPQIEAFGKAGFDFLDLTLEPEEAYAGDVDISKIKKLVKKYKLLVVGHTPWSLPLASTFKSVRNAAYKEFVKCLEVFSELGVQYVNIHPSMSGGAKPEDMLKYNIDFMKRIVKKAKAFGIDVMMENTSNIFNELEVIAQILHEVPDLKLHWDVAHANLGNEGEKKTKLAFMNFKDRIVHVHISDNNGQEDQHMPLGIGNIDWEFVVKTLKEHDYDGTITLEVHVKDESYLELSKEKLAKLWEKVK